MGGCEPLGVFASLREIILIRAKPQSRKATGYRPDLPGQGPRFGVVAEARFVKEKGSQPGR